MFLDFKKLDELIHKLLSITNKYSYDQENKEQISAKSKIKTSADMTVEIRQAITRAYADFGKSGVNHSFLIKNIINTCEDKMTDPVRHDSYLPSLTLFKTGDFKAEIAGFIKEYKSRDYSTHVTNKHSYGQSSC